MVELRRSSSGRYELDLRGYACPYPVLFTRKYFTQLSRGDEVEILIDNPLSCETVPAAVEELNGEVISIEPIGNGTYRIVARKQ
ncbi:sulfurtransferase TusA family protein [Caldivirga maquilingensis]|nr:sulfurtransferase TusA family protein [Caldivirga maquilingensis]